ncbi:MAG: hypothetical protein LBI69_00385 [Puniceicoccales bacterium]|jgi:hypothetical protein|nr:hypothetical protein [Puniceicoccales bacterium]
MSQDAIQNLSQFSPCPDPHSGKKSTNIANRSVGEVGKTNFEKFPEEPMKLPKNFGKTSAKQEKFLKDWMVVLAAIAGAIVVGGLAALGTFFAMQFVAEMAVIWSLVAGVGVAGSIVGAGIIAFCLFSENFEGNDISLGRISSEAECVFGAIMQLKEAFDQINLDCQSEIDQLIEDKANGINENVKNLLLKINQFPQKTQLFSFATFPQITSNLEIDNCNCKVFVDSLEKMRAAFDGLRKTSNISRATLGFAHLAMVNLIGSLRMNSTVAECCNDFIESKYKELVFLTEACNYKTKRKYSIDFAIAVNNSLGKEIATLFADGNSLMPKIDVQMNKIYVSQENDSAKLLLKAFEKTSDVLMVNFAQLAINGQSEMAFIENGCKANITNYLAGMLAAIQCLASSLKNDFPITIDGLFARIKVELCKQSDENSQEKMKNFIDSIISLLRNTLIKVNPELPIFLRIDAMISELTQLNDRDRNIEVSEKINALKAQSLKLQNLCNEVSIAEEASISRNPYKEGKDYSKARAEKQKKVDAENKKKHKLIMNIEMTLDQLRMKIENLEK